MIKNCTPDNSYVNELKKIVKEKFGGRDHLSVLLGDTGNFVNRSTVSRHFSKNNYGFFNLIELYLSNFRFVEHTRESYMQFLVEKELNNFNNPRFFSNFKDAINAIRPTQKKPLVDSSLLDLISLKTITRTPTRMTVHNAFNANVETQHEVPYSALQYLFAVSQFEKSELEDRFMIENNFILPYQSELTKGLLNARKNIRPGKDSSNGTFECVISDRWQEYVKENIPQLSQSSEFQRFMHPNGIKRIVLGGQTEELNENSPIVQNFQEFVDSLSKKPRRSRFSDG